jgi:nitrate reductase delta subunit
MTRTLKILSALLSYPAAELQDNISGMQDIVGREGVLTGQVRRALNPLFEDIARGELYDLQERYVLLFDRTRSLSLHLFEHVHGESRDRGQAMVDLQTMYAQKGLELGTPELPDFLPLFLEFLSLLPRAEAFELLGQPAHIFAAIAERLRRRSSPYEAVFRALVALAKDKPKGEDIAAALQAPDIDPNDLAALDAAWEDEEVRFGPGSGDSCKDGLIARVRAGMRPAPDMPPAASQNPATRH